MFNPKENAMSPELQELFTVLRHISPNASDKLDKAQMIDFLKAGIETAERPHHNVDFEAQFKSKIVKETIEVVLTMIDTGMLDAA